MQRIKRSKSSEAAGELLLRTVRIINQKYKLQIEQMKQTTNRSITTHKGKRTVKGVKTCTNGWIYETKSHSGISFSD